MNEKITIKNPVIKQTEMEICAIRDEVALAGANDFEIPALNNLIVRLQNEECTPEFALKEARTIRDRKQNYH